MKEKGEMRFIRQYRCLPPIGSITLSFVLAGLFSGCQSVTSDPNPVVVTPIDSTKPGSKDSVKVKPSDTASLSLLSPKGDEIYALGDSLHVTATAEGNEQGTINAVDVFLSPDGGQTWGALSDRPLSVDALSSMDFSWKIPASFAANGKTFSLAENRRCMIRIAQQNTDDPLKTSVSGLFMIEDTVSIRLTHPLGGESFKVGDTLHFIWTVKDDVSDPVYAVDVRISADSGETWAFLRAGSITSESAYWGRFPWIVRDSITVSGKKTNIVGSPGVCFRVEQYSSPDPDKRFQSGMISILPP